MTITQAINTNACPTCGVGVGVDCVSKAGKPTKSHTARVVLLDKNPALLRAVGPPKSVVWLRVGC